MAYNSRVFQVEVDVTYTVFDKVLFEQTFTIPVIAHNWVMALTRAVSTNLFDTAKIEIKTINGKTPLEWHKESPYDTQEEDLNTYLIPQEVIEHHYDRDYTEVRFMGIVEDFKTTYDNIQQAEVYYDVIKDTTYLVVLTDRGLYRPTSDKYDTYPANWDEQVRMSEIALERAKINVTTEVLQEITIEIEGGKRVVAVKIYRQHTHCGLKEAVHAIKRIERLMHFNINNDEE